ncbi:zinc finger protein 417-like [Trichoplusia ni]|uniref:Zinc finger protein 417-like n=1 Tax=Trichoplusia ni TaxID=7111 RepID=A0A7E5WYI4_TRINI|nr:zinc finger protein 417-like [Trichoplusia ni]
MSDFLNDLTTSHKTKNLYIEIGKEIRTYTDTLRCPVKKITSRKEALSCFKIRLRQQMVYRNRLADDKKDRFSPQSEDKNRKMTCTECKVIFRDLFTFNRHISNLNKKMCGQCFQVFEMNAFVDHYKSHDLPIFPCTVCPESFEKESTLLTHKLKHSRGTEECVECRQTFQSAAHLNKHTNKHEAMICGCGKKFPNGICFLSHKKFCSKHKNIKSSYICDYCNKNYTKKNCLKMHIKLRHTVGWVFQCDKCGKRLSSKAHLIEHGNTHLRVMDRHVCHCGAMFSSRRGYERHLKKHESKKLNLVMVKKKDILLGMRPEC